MRFFDMTPTVEGVSDKLTEIQLATADKLLEYLRDDETYTEFMDDLAVVGYGLECIEHAQRLKCGIPTLSIREGRIIHEPRPEE